MPRRPIIAALRRLPSITDEDAQALLGAAGDHLLDPTGLQDLVEDETDTTTTTTTEPPPEEPDEPEEPEETTP